jgi:hypothetical protein
MNLLPGILALQIFLVFNSLGKLQTRSSRHNGPGAAASHHQRGISLLDSSSQHQNLNPRAPFDDADAHAYGSASWWVCFLPFLHCNFFSLSSILLESSTPGAQDIKDQCCIPWSQGHFISSWCIKTSTPESKCTGWWSS